MFGALKPGIRSLATLKLVVNVMSLANFKPKRTHTHCSCGIARFPTFQTRLSCNTNLLCRKNQKGVFLSVSLFEITHTIWQVDNVSVQAGSLFCRSWVSNISREFSSNIQGGPKKNEATLHFPKYLENC